MIGSEQKIYVRKSKAVSDKATRPRLHVILRESVGTNFKREACLGFSRVQTGTLLRRTFSRPRSEPRKYSRSKANKIRRTYTVAAEKAAFADPKTL
jgi:hypothetical protein